MKIPLKISHNLLISLAFHILLLIILSLIFVSPIKIPTEIFLEWATEPFPRLEELKSTIVSSFPGKPGVAQTETVKPQAANQAVQHTVTSEQAPSQVQQNQQIHVPRIGDLEESPQTATDVTGKTARKTKFGSSLASAISVRTPSGTGVGGGFLFDDEEGSVTILEKHLPQTQITDFGKIILQFEISRDGNVVKNSIIPIRIDGAAYTSLSIEALQKWKFSVRKYNPYKRYQISFIFNPQ